MPEGRRILCHRVFQTRKRSIYTTMVLFGDFQEEKRKRRGSAAGNGARNKLRLEHQPQAKARTERLLEEIVVHSKSRKWQLEVLVFDAEALIGVLIDECLGLPISDVEGIESKLKADPLIELPRVLEVSVDTCRRGCATEVAATEQRHFAGILISLLRNQCS